jgi:hypothetical protein
VTYRYGITEGGHTQIFEKSKQSEEWMNRTLEPDATDIVIEDVFMPPAMGSSEEAELHLLDESLRMGMVKKSESCDFATSLKELMGTVRNLYLVCFHLPIKVSRGQAGVFDVEWAESLIAKSEGSVSNSMKTYWIGTVSVPGEPLTPTEISTLTTKLKQMNCIPVFLDPQVHNDT